MMGSHSDKGWLPIIYKLSVQEPMMLAKARGEKAHRL